MEGVWYWNKKLEKGEGNLGIVECTQMSKNGVNSALNFSQDNL